MTLKRDLLHIMTAILDGGPIRYIKETCVTYKTELQHVKKRPGRHAKETQMTYERDLYDK